MYRYESDGGTFTAELEVDDRGIVTRYADIWRAGPHVRKGLSVDEENRHCLDGDPRRATDVWTAFASAEAMESWLPPDGMSARMLTFDFRDGGSYRVRLTYDEAADAPGKTSVDADEVEVRLVRVVPNETIEQAATFESEDSAFVGVMPSNETCPQESVSRITLNYRSCLATE